jgi:hypothetical protein
VDNSLGNRRSAKINWTSVLGTYTGEPTPVRSSFRTGAFVCVPIGLYITGMVSERTPQIQLGTPLAMRGTLIQRCPPEPLE